MALDFSKFVVIKDVDEAKSRIFGTKKQPSAEAF